VTAGRLERRHSARWQSARWQGTRGPVAVAALLLLAVTLVTVVTGASARGQLDPESVAPDGSRALATLLAEDGVVVHRVERPEEAARVAAAGSTVLVAFPDLLADAQARQLADSGADLVLLAPATPEAYVEGVTVRSTGSRGGPRAPACALPAAQRAGDADVTAVTYDVRLSGGAQAALCYARDGFAALVSVSAGGVRTTVLGDARPLTNEHLAEHGNAALAMNLLGSHPDLVWYLPPVTAAAAPDGPSLLSLLPAGIWWATAQVAVAVALAAVWRARRLGPVVAEPLPVAVRAAEATEGRARLYRRFRSRDRASAALREAARDRLLRRLSLPRAAGGPEVVPVVAARTGRHPAQVDALLYGAAPSDDAALVRLADALDTLEREVRRS
jgi:hypothetical protein